MTGQVSAIDESVAALCNLRIDGYAMLLYGRGSMNITRDAAVAIITAIRDGVVPLPGFICFDSFNDFERELITLREQVKEFKEASRQNDGWLLDEKKELKHVQFLLAHTMKNLNIMERARNAALGELSHLKDNLREMVRGNDEAKDRKAKDEAEVERLRAVIKILESECNEAQDALYGQRNETSAEQAESAGLSAALREAAISLQTIAKLAGIDQCMEIMSQVRGFANSRFIVANKALGDLKVSP